MEHQKRNYNCQRVNVTTSQRPGTIQKEICFSQSSPQALSNKYKVYSRHLYTLWLFVHKQLHTQPYPAPRLVRIVHIYGAAMHGKGLIDPVLVLKQFCAEIWV